MRPALWLAWPRRSAASEMPRSLRAHDLMQWLQCCLRMASEWTEWSECHVSMSESLQWEQNKKTNSEPHNLNQCMLLPQLEQLEVVFAALTKERHLKAFRFRWINEFLEFLMILRFCILKTRELKGSNWSNDQFISIHFRGLSIADASLAQSTARPPNVWLPHATLLCKGLRPEDPSHGRRLQMQRCFIFVKDCSCFKQGCVAGLKLGPVASLLQLTPRSSGSSSHWK